MDINADLIAFLQRTAGYSLTGETGEECLIFLHRTGRNGKSKLLGALQHVIGEYGQPTRIETLMSRNNSPIPNDIAALKGARFVHTNEVEDGQRFAENLVKQLTGGDRISARFLHAEFFEFQPIFKIWLAANHKPVIRGTDNAIWERIRLIPFSVTIPEGERDLHLAEKLAAEGPGILRWMVDGCRAWQHQGLCPPTEVRQATEDYRSWPDRRRGVCRMASELPATAPRHAEAAPLFVWWIPRWLARPSP
jgi:putative DNA primase/helicase